MFRNRLFQAVLLFSLFFSACNPFKPAGLSPQPLPSPSGDWKVTLTQTGGFAGVSLTVEVSSNGQLTAEDTRTGKKVKEALPPQTIAQLRQLISNTNISSSTPMRSGCADCFIYNLELQSNGKNYRIQLDDTNINDSGAADLIGFLRELRDKALSNS